MDQCSTCGPIMMSSRRNIQKDMSVVDLLRTEDGLAWRRLHMGKARLREARGTSFILGAFSMSTMTELQVDVTTTCPTWLFTIFAVNTVLLITVHMFSLIISTCLLPSLEAVAREYETPRAGGIIRPVPEFSPHDRLRGLITLSVNLSSVLGLLLFLLEVALLAWVKFWDHARAACWAGSLIMAPAIIMFFLFCWHFHRTLRNHAYATRIEEIRQLEAWPGVDMSREIRIHCDTKC